MNDTDQHSSESDWSDVEEETGVLEHESVCLFCNKSFDITAKTFAHMNESHAFNLIEFCKERNIDFYSYIKLVNYIRANKIESKDAKNLEECSFQDENYFRPVIEDDMLLQVDFDTLKYQNHSGVEDSLKNVSKEDELREKLKQAEERALRSEQSLTRAVEDFNSCKADMQKLLLQSADTQHSKEQSIGREDDSHAYFQSYAHYGIHEEMLKDSIRTEAYKNFIMSNKDFFQNKIVLDIGCGTGILSMFAAKAGAKCVFAIDQSEIAYQAMDIVRENGLDDVIKVKKCNAEDFVLPSGVDKVDVIISEWMGYFLLFESMLDTILTCRDKLLSKDGMVFPDVCSISLAALCDHEMWDGKIDFWNDVHGCKMSCMKKYVVREAIIDIVHADKIISKPCEVLNLNIMKAKIADLDYEEEFELSITKNAFCTGIVGYFNIGFQGGLSEPVSFSTSCESTPTHWKQTVFLFEKKLGVDQGETLQCAIQCKKDPQEPRSLIVKLHIVKQDKSQNVKQLYVIN